MSGEKNKDPLNCRNYRMAITISSVMICHPVFVEQNSEHHLGFGPISSISKKDLSIPHLHKNTVRKVKLGIELKLFANRRFK